MKTVNMPEARTHLSRLAEDAARGEPFVIARSGKPLVKVTVIDREPPRRPGFLAGQAAIPEDFDDLGADTIRALFKAADPLSDDPLSDPAA